MCQISAVQLLGACNTKSISIAPKYGDGMGSAVVFSGPIGAIGQHFSPHFKKLRSNYLRPPVGQFMMIENLA